MENKETVYTVTMAKLYEKQGLWVRAQRIYEHLLQESPQRLDIREALENLKAMQGGAEHASRRLKPLFEQWVGLQMALQKQQRAMDLARKGAESS